MPPWRYTREKWTNSLYFSNSIIFNYIHFALSTFLSTLNYKPMKVYDEKHIKNIALLGAPKSGKTLLSEDMIFESGIVRRRGTIEGKNTVSDYHEIEQERGNSVFATVMHTEWRDYKINIIDTPGFDDFAGEMVSSLRVADTCVMVINAQHGMEVGTKWGGNTATNTKRQSCLRSTRSINQNPIFIRP